MPWPTWRSRPQAAPRATASRLGRSAVSISLLPVSGRGRPPRPSREHSPILLAAVWTRGRTNSRSMKLGVLDRVLEGAEAGDLEANGVPRLQHHGRLAREAHAGGRAGGDHVAGLERQDAREVADDVADVEDE